MRNEEFCQSTARKRGLAISEVSIIILFVCYYTASLVEGRSMTNFSSDSDSSAGNSEEATCLTPECIHTASSILKNMDPNVDPCHDFYRYACGGFINETIIPDSENSVSSFHRLSEKLHEQLKLQIEAEIESAEPRSFGLVKNFYKLCMNTTAIEAAGLTPLRAQLDKLGGWPVVLGDAWNESTFLWTDAICKLRHSGYSYSYLIDLRVSVDANNTTKRVIVLDEGNLGISKAYLSKGRENKIVNAYYSYMVDVAVMLGADEHRALEELNETLIFEMRLANISLSEEKRRNATELNNPMTLAELLEKYPTIEWREYLRRLLPLSMNIDDKEVVIVRTPRYMAELAKLLSETSKRIQANYLTWRAVASSIIYLNSEIRERRRKYSTLFTGNTEPEARSKHCAETVSAWFPIVTGAMYVRRYFNEEAKKNVAEIVMDIREELMVTLKEVDWMDEQTRVRAMNKVTAMFSHIGYPDELLDDEKVDKFYEKLESFGNDYLQCVLNLSLFYADYSLGKLREPVNRTDWTSHGASAVVNAFYSQLGNSLQFPAGILQGTFFNNDRPKYMNYGAIGYIIGHEITHGFDDEGKQFDENGNLVNWWAPETERNYLRRVQCIIEQYGNYSLPEVELKVNGLNTQGENVADIGGIKIAYLAYERWVSRNQPEKKLPAINKTPEQMFFLSAANVWCSKSKREYLRSNVISDEHSPSDLRILGSFSNMPQFANAFQCPEGSRMNPNKKCSIW